MEKYIVKWTSQFKKELIKKRGYDIYIINTEDALASAHKFMEIYDEAFKELAK